MIAVALTGEGLRLGQSRILHPFSLRLEAGECVAIIGPSGAGKTSLLRLLGTELRGEGSLSLQPQAERMQDAALAEPQSFPCQGDGDHFSRPAWVAAASMPR